MNTKAPSTAVGLGLTVLSVAAFSWLGVLTQLAYAHGATVGTVLSGRFLIAAAMLWPLVWLTRARLPSRRQIAVGIVIGVGYSAHSWLYAESLARLQAGLVDLLLFTYPAFVTVGAVLLGRDRWSRQRALALLTTGAGTVFVLLGDLGAVDPGGTILAIAASLAYTAYILGSNDELDRTGPLVLIALVTTAAGLTLTMADAATGRLSFGAGSAADVDIALLGIVATIGMTTFIAGIGRLGPSRASIVSALQPALTPVIGFAVFTDRLGPSETIGGALVIAGVVLLEAEARSPAPWLVGLPVWERWLIRRTRRLELPSGALILQQGSSARAFYLIERGRATVTRDGRDIAVLGPGEFFGEVALLGGGARTASVVAATDLRVRIVHQRRFARTMRMLPTLARTVERVTCERMLAMPPQPATVA